MTHAIYEEKADRFSLNVPPTDLPRVVIVGGGFAGLQVAKRLQKTKCQVVMIDRHNYHTFQPLLYQIATGGLEPNSIASPLRKLLHHNHYYFRVAEAEAVEPSTQMLRTSIGRIRYDHLVLAYGSQTTFFGMDDVERNAIPMKTIPNALDLRSYILQNLEQAVIKNNPIKRQEFTNFVIAGGGPTGVELAGAMAELKRFVVKNDYPEINHDEIEIYLVEMADRLLPAMSEQASQKAHEYLEEFGVNIILNNGVKSYDGDYVRFFDQSSILSNTLIWAAGVEVKPLSGLPSSSVNPRGRIKVNSYHQVHGFDRIYALGDIAYMETDLYPNGHPQLAPVAIQQGRSLGKNLVKKIKNTKKQPRSFEFEDPGVMATIGRNRAVVDLKHLKLQGVFAWFLWMFAHIMYIIGFRNKLIVFFDWVYNYLTYDRATRLIIRPYRRQSKKKGAL